MQTNLRGPGLSNTTGNSPGESNRTNGFDLNTEELVEIMMAPLKIQDPQDPMKTEEMVGQTSQLIQLENSKAMNCQANRMSDRLDSVTGLLGELTRSAEVNRRASRMGEEVSLPTEDGRRMTDQLERIRRGSQENSIRIEGGWIPMRRIQ